MKIITCVNDLDKICNTTKEIRLKIENLLIDDVLKIASALEKNKTIESIDLSHTRIGDKGAKAIATALEKNNTITSIDLWRTQIRHEGAKAIASALEKNDTITSINLGWNQIGDEGASAIASALEKNVTITYINLEYTRISDEVNHNIYDVINNKWYFNSFTTAYYVFEKTHNKSIKKKLRSLVHHTIENNSSDRDEYHYYSHNSRKLNIISLIGYALTRNR